MIDIDIITKISEEVFSTHSVVLVNASKIIAAVVFLVASAQKFMTEYALKGENKVGSKEGFGPYDILRVLIMLVLIGLMPELLTLIDKILNGLLDLFLGDFGSELTAMKLGDIDVKPYTEDETVFQSILSTLLEIKQYISPVAMINSAIIGLGYYIDIIIFLIFLGKRFFALGVIKILSPLLVAFSIFPKYHELIYNIGKVYVRTFLTIIPLLLVNVFANQFYQMFMEYMTDTVGRTATMIVAGETIKAVTLLGFLWMKLKLFKYSTEIMKSLWP